MGALDLSCTLAESSENTKAKDVLQVHRACGDELEISFRRTIRVPDGKDNSELPPDLGTFPLYSAADYQRTLPQVIAAKGGVFFPMYQREAMWIRFKSRAPFAIHIYLGGVNAVSGEPLMENAATMLRRQNLRFNNKSVQDYVVTPQQLWLDGIASNEGIVRQFVAMPMGSGYSVEAQVSGEELVGGLQFCITPSTRTTKGITIETPTLISLKVQPLVGKIILVDVLDCGYVKDIKYKILKKEGIPTDQQRLVFCGKKLEDDLTLPDYNIREGNLLHLVSALRGGGGGGGNKAVAEMGIAPGGLIKQCIIGDKHPSSAWDSERTVMFKVQILNSELFHAVTGKSPPKSPISAKTYAQHGLPFYKIYEEKSSIMGNF